MVIRLNAGHSTERQRRDVLLNIISTFQLAVLDNESVSGPAGSRRKLSRRLSLRPLHIAVTTRT